MGAAQSLPVPGAMMKKVCLFVILLSFSFFSACEREQLREQDDETTGEAAREEVAEDIPSPYDEPDVDPIFPEDMGPPAPAIYFTAGLKGYTEPCGCTADVLLGGIDRITAFGLDSMALHEEALFIDAGDWLFEFAELPDHMHPQERAKAKVLAEAHRRLGTLFSVPGDRDFALGVEFYAEMMGLAEMKVLSSNLEWEESVAQTSVVVDFEEYRIRFVGITSPEMVKHVSGLQVKEPLEGLERALSSADDEDVIVLIFQGRAEDATALVEALPKIDIVILGHDPVLSEDSRDLAGRPGFEAHDQGRYVGRLKLYQVDQEGPFFNARRGIDDQRKSLRAQISNVEQDLRVLEVRTGGERNPLMERLEERLEGLREDQRKIMRTGIELTEGERIYLFDLIPMEPGFRLDEEMRELRRQYNRSLPELNRDLQREVPPVEEGQPFFIGTAECAVCHGDAHRFWEETRHASAVATLTVRDKDYDQNCIGCHVVGWEEPGGSVLGKLVYEAELAGRTFEKDLRNVGCESCHGAGSNHRLQPLGSDGIAQHIIRHPTEAQCTSCHVPEHSPRFDFDVYVQRITGEGHELRAREE